MLSDEAEEYINSVVEIMKNEALHQKKLDFVSIHQILRYQANGTQSLEDTHPIINRYARVLLADGHSQLMPAKRVKQLLDAGYSRYRQVKKRHFTTH